MGKLNLNLILIFLTVFMSSLLYSQNNINLIIFINDEIITSPLELNFSNQLSKKEYKVIYSPGKEIDYANNDIFKENLILQFNAYGDKEDPAKRYSYSIPLEAGLFKDTSFLIIKIYNLDKKEYRKKYCKSKEPYVVDFHKSGLYIDTTLTKCN
ncbi:hypothetical protein [Chryseobacterium sp.]|uniref:hypothetical protein n=1 Tax=Chryseobacterium sp. TaxID=1871047 RepID=UPI00321BA415